MIEKSIAVGMGGQLANNVDVALRNMPRRAAAAFGGRRLRRPPDHAGVAAPLFRPASVQPWEGTHFLDLNERVVGREIHRARKGAGARDRPPRTSCAELAKSVQVPAAE